MKKYVLYEHVAPDGRVYIGITSRKNPKSRWQNGTGYSRNTYFTRAIKKYGWDNFKHIILKTDLSEEEAKKLEIEYISKFKSNQRKYGFNISSGGESKSGTVISEYQKQRIREGTKNRVFTDNGRKKLSENAKKQWSDPSHVKHLKEINTGEKNPMYGRKLTDIEKKRHGAKTVVQYDMEGNFIESYISIHKASECTNISRDGISKCCKGIFRQCCGFQWKFAE